MWYKLDILPTFGVYIPLIGSVFNNYCEAILLSVQCSWRRSEDRNILCWCKKWILHLSTQYVQATMVHEMWGTILNTSNPPGVRCGYFSAPSHSIPLPCLSTAEADWSSWCQQMSEKEEQVWTFRRRKTDPAEDSREETVPHQGSLVAWLRDQQYESSSGRIPPVSGFVQPNFQSRPPCPHGASAPRRWQGAGQFEQVGRHPSPFLWQHPTSPGWWLSSAANGRVLLWNMSRRIKWRKRK